VAGHWLWRLQLLLQVWTRRASRPIGLRAHGGGGRRLG